MNSSGCNRAKTTFDFEAFFRAQYVRAARAVARVTGDPARAEDLASEAFWKLWRNPQAHGESAVGWLYRTALRLALNELRGRERRGRYESLSSPAGGRDTRRGTRRRRGARPGSRGSGRSRCARRRVAAVTRRRPELQRGRRGAGNQPSVGRDADGPRPAGVSKGICEPLWRTIEWKIVNGWMAAWPSLDPAADWRPDTSRALGRLHNRRRARRVNWICGFAAAAALLIGVNAITPRACANPLGCGKPPAAAARAVPGVAPLPAVAVPPPRAKDRS